MRPMREPRDVSDNPPVVPQDAFLYTEDGVKTILNGIGDGFYAVDRGWRVVLFND